MRTVAPASSSLPSTVSVSDKVIPLSRATALVAPLFVPPGSVTVPPTSLAASVGARFRNRLPGASPLMLDRAPMKASPVPFGLTAQTPSSPGGLLLGLIWSPLVSMK